MESMTTTDQEISANRHALARSIIVGEMVLWLLDCGMPEETAEDRTCGEIVREVHSQWDGGILDYGAVHDYATNSDFLALVAEYLPELDTAPVSVTLYTVGHNLVGYSPESDVYTCETFDHARTCLLDTMDRNADSLDWGRTRDAATRVTVEDSQRCETEFEELHAAMAELKDDTGPDWDTIVGYVHYWIRSDELSPGEAREILADQEG